MDQETSTVKERMKRWEKQEEEYQRQKNKQNLLITVFFVGVLGVICALYFYSKVSEQG